MTVLSVRETAESGPLDYTGPWGKQYRRMFDVETSTVNDSSVVVVDATDLPSLGDTFQCGADEDLTARVTRILPNRNKDRPTLWHVTVIYHSIPYALLPLGDTEIQHRVNLPPGIRYGGLRYTKPMDVDTRGFLVVNSARLPFDPPMQVDRHRSWVEIQRFEPEPSYIQAPEWLDKINADQFMGVAATQAKVSDIAGERHFAKDGSGIYWDVRYLFEFKKEGWQDWLLDHGTHKLKQRGVCNRSLPVADQVEPITDKSGNPLLRPQALDNFGHPAPASVVNSGEAFYLYYEGYFSRSFAPLGMSDLITIHL